MFCLKESKLLCHLLFPCSQMKSYFATYEEFFFENLPKLHAHFEKQGLTPDLYIIDW